jgi:sugar phosphate permease
MSQRLYYGWIIAFASFIAICITNGVTISGITVFDEALLKEFGWSRGALKFRATLTFVITGLLAPFSGMLADRFGARRLMMFGAAMLSVSIFFYSQISSLAHLYAIHILFALTLATCSILTVVFLTSRWFVAKRGLALGFVIVGTSMGGIVFPQLNTWLNATYGWRTSFQILALVPLALVPLIYLLVRDRPSDLGLVPLGESTTPGGPPPELRGLTYHEALRTPTFWALTVMAFGTFAAIMGIVDHLFLHLRGMQLTPVEAARGLSFLFWLGLVGKFLFGYLADVFSPKYVAMSNIAIMLAGCVLLSSMSVDSVWMSIALFGFGWGGIYTLLQVLVLGSFGNRAAGRILGTLIMVEAFGGGLGPFVMGVLFDRTGNYQSAFVLASVLVGAALAASFVVRYLGTLTTPSPAHAKAVA